MWPSCACLPEAEHAAESLWSGHVAVKTSGLDGRGHVDRLGLRGTGSGQSGRGRAGCDDRGDNLGGLLASTTGDSDGLGDLVGESDSLDADGHGVDTDGDVGGDLVGDSLGDDSLAGSRDGSLLADGTLGSLSGRNHNGGLLTLAGNSDDTGASRDTVGDSDSSGADLTVRLSHGDNNYTSGSSSDSLVSLGGLSTKGSRANGLRVTGGLSSSSGLSSLGGRSSLSGGVDLGLRRDDTSASGDTVSESDSNGANLAIGLGHGDNGDSLRAFNSTEGSLSSSLRGLGTQSGRTSGLSIGGSLSGGSLSGLDSTCGGRALDDGGTIGDSARLRDSKGSGRDDNMAANTGLGLASDLSVRRKNDGGGLSGLLGDGSRSLSSGRGIGTANFTLLLAIRDLEVLSGVLRAVLELLVTSVSESLAELREGLLVRAGTDNEVALVATLDGRAGGTNDDGAVEDGNFADDNNDRLVHLADNSAAGSGLRRNGTGEFIRTSGLSASGNSGVGERSGLSGDSALSLSSGEDDGGRNRSLSLSAGVSLISGSVGSLSSVVDISGLLLDRGGGLGRGLGGVLGSSGSLKSSRGVQGGLANDSSGNSLGLTTSTLGARNGDGLVDVASSTTGDERGRDNSGHVSSLLSDGTGVSGLGSGKSLDLSGSSLGNGLAGSLRHSLRSTSSCGITRSSGISS
ncbi:hypothetical protein NOF04DRAFT_1058410 [Fusarium oxysporum II5]|nr:hypothetical protein NOF04DRAFT_1058410 [Fusarium oxysporum II5]